MRTLVCRAGVAGLLALAIWGAAVPDARAQTPNQQDPTFIGVPEHYAQSVDLSFYSVVWVGAVEALIAQAKDAATRCSRADYDKARKTLEDMVGGAARDTANRARNAARGSVDEQSVRRETHDAAQLQKALEKFPPYPDDCFNSPANIAKFLASKPPTDPQFPSTATGLAFFHDSLQRQVDTYYGFAEEAVRDCNRKAFEFAKGMLQDMIATNTQEHAKRATELSKGPLVPGMGPAQAEGLRQLQHDIGQIQRAIDKLGNFDDRCPKEKKVGALIDVFIQGGAALAFQSNGYFRALDTFSGETPTAFGGRSLSTGVFGGGVRVNVLKVNPTFFFETRFQTAFGAPSYQQTAGLSGPNAPFQAPFGEVLVRENWGIPLLLGTTWSLGNVGRLGEFGVDVYGGITIANWTQSLSGGEAGIPGTPGYSVQQTKTSIDPTFGVGVRLPTVDLNGDGRADVILGVYGELAFRQGSSITAVSPSNSGLTYTGSIDSRPTASLMLRLSVPLGGGPLFRVD